MSDITGTLKGLRDGTVSLDDAAGQFRQRQWPVRVAHEPPAYRDVIAADLADPEPEPDGGFGEVEAAYAAGWITDEQYAALAQAAAEGIRGQMAVQPQVKTAGGPPLAAGSYVKWSGGTGRIDLVVKDGKVPGVDSDVTGTADDPAVRVTVWDKSGPTDRKVAMKLSAVSRTAPLRSGGGESKDARLVTMLAAHEERVTELPGYASPGARAVMAVYDRGVAAWPGETKTALTRDEWAAGRVEAFLDLAAGEVKLAGYTGDIDLLPAGHPARDGYQ